MEILIKDNVKYLEYVFTKEIEFENTVFSQYKEIFGDKTILFDKQKIKTSTGIGTIPDAFIIDLEYEKWFIIEIELSRHDVYNHIVPQLTKFSSALNNIQTRKLLLKSFEKEIKEDPFKNAMFIVSGKNEIYKTISEIIEKEPELIIVLEKPHKELMSIFNSLPFKTKINIFKTFTREGFGLGDNIFFIEPIYRGNKKTFETKKVKDISDLQNFKNKVEKYQKGRDQLIDYILPAVKLIKNGQSHNNVFHNLASELNVSYQTVSARCIRDLGINTKKFIELINSNEIKRFLQNKFTNSIEIIETEL